jgi:antitoxin component YwqK of YwqJK toxin-antitoxin module
MLTLEIRKPRCIQWCTITNISHNLLGPAYTYWHSNGQKEREAYYVNDKLYRNPNLGPATTFWYENGQKERESYYVDDKLHRDPQLGPATTRWYSDGQRWWEHYYVNGKSIQL